MAKNTIQTYIEKTEQLEALQDQVSKLQIELEDMKNDSEIEKQISEYDNYKKMLANLDPAVRRLIESEKGSQKQQPASTDGRSTKRMNRWTNPHTGEVVEAKGGNVKELKAWREEHGTDEVAKWKEQI